MTQSKQDEQSQPASQSSRREQRSRRGDERGEGGKGGTRGSHIIVARPSTTRPPPEDGALFLPKRTPATNRFFLRRQMWLNNRSSTISTTALALAGYSLYPRTTIAFFSQIAGIEGPYITPFKFIHFTHNTPLSRSHIEGNLPPREFGLYTHYRNQT